MIFDLKLFYFFNNFAGQNSVFDFFVMFFSEYLQYILVVLFLFFLFSARRAMWDRVHIFLVAISAIIIARLGITELIRFFYHRPRPFITYEVHKLIVEQGWSFPSGHSAFFFALATAVYCYDKKWGIGFFIASMVMNISRVVAGVHYPTDILGGMAVGITVVWIVYPCAEKISVGRIMRDVEK